MSPETPGFRPFRLEELPTVDAARQRWLRALSTGRPPGVETVPLAVAHGRVLAEDVIADAPVPPFARSLVDGVAVRAGDTAPADSSDGREGRPVTIRLLGRIRMGTAPPWSLQPGEGAIVPTGGVLPGGADAVIMVEEFPELLGHGVESGLGSVTVRRRVQPGENVIPRGADVERGQVVLRAGHRLRPHDLGVLAALGRTSIPVFRRPEVAIVCTGAELVEPSREPGPGQIRDMNGVSLAALVEQGGGRVRWFGIVPDDPKRIRDAIVDGLRAHMVVISGGSSVGEEDWVARILAEMGPPGVIVHGIRMAPGKPTVAALIGDTPVVGVPGNPVSAQVVFRLFGVPALRRAAGETNGAGWEPTVRARLTAPVSTPRGRDLYMRVALERGDECWLARPIYGGSHQLMTMVEADGFIVVPADETLPAGAWVDVRPWR